MNPFVIAVIAAVVGIVLGYFIRQILLTQEIRRMKQRLIRSSTRQKRRPG